MKDLTIFNYQDTEVRTAELDGAPAIVLTDIAKVLGYRDANTAGRLLRDHHKGYAEVRTPGGTQRMLVVTEKGFNRLVIRSNAANAEDVQDWITDDVMPAIRKHGGYLTPDKVEEVLADPDTIIRLATDLKNERERRAALEAQAEADKPKVLFADAVSTSKTTILVGELAKILRANGVEVGQNRLFEYLREKGFLIRRKGSDWNMPTQRSMEMGLFEIKETAITHSDGHISISKTTKVTGRGQQYFIDMFLGVAA